MRYALPLMLVSAGLAACGAAEETPTAVDVNGKAPAVTFTPDESIAEQYIGKPSGPVRIEHRIIGTPAVGQPVTIDVRLEAIDTGRPVDFSYRMPDESALDTPPDQVREVSLAFADDERFTGHQFTVIPQRTGRLYVNVSASIETPEGTVSTVTAIPIQVGEGGRALQENGTVVETESGELIRALPAKE